MIGQVIMRNGDPTGGALFVMFVCQKCNRSQHTAGYDGDDILEIRKRVHTDGWRQRAGDWYKDECVPKGNEDG